MNLQTVNAGKHKLQIEEVRKGIYVIRLDNGVALSLGCNKRLRYEIVEEVSIGLWDKYISQHCQTPQK